MAENSKNNIDAYDTWHKTLLTCSPTLRGHKVKEGWDDVGVVVGGVARPQVEQEVHPGQVHIAQAWTSEHNIILILNINIS